MRGPANGPAVTSFELIPAVVLVLRGASDYRQANGGRGFLLPAANHGVKLALPLTEQETRRESVI